MTFKVASVNGVAQVAFTNFEACLDAPSKISSTLRDRSPMLEKHERAWIGLILLAFLLVNVVTAERYPFPFFDEVLYSDPAVNYVIGHGFTSAVHAQNSPVFYFYNGPAYSALLIPWLKAFGISLQSVRSINFVYMAITVLLIWSASKRTSLILSTGWRLLLVSMLLCDYAIVFSYRCARYDCLGMLTVGFAFWSFSIKSAQFRLAALAAAGAASPWVGLQLLPLEALLGGTLVVFTGLLYRREIVVFVMGVVAGSLGLVHFFAMHGVLGYFLEFLRSQSKGVGFVAGLLHGEFRHSNLLPKDFSLPLVMTAAALMAIVLHRGRAFRWRSPLAYGLTFVPLLGLALILLAKFPTYYGWMTYIPLAVCVCASLDLTLPTRIRGFAIGLCVLANVVGLGAHVLACASDWRDRDYAKVRQFVKSSVRFDDWVYADPQVYYPAKLASAATFFWDPANHMSSYQKDHLTVCVIGPDRAWLLKEIGGQWYSTGQEMIPAHTGMFGDRWGLLSIPNYRLSVYRRIPGTHSGDSVSSSIQTPNPRHRKIPGGNLGL